MENTRVPINQGAHHHRFELVSFGSGDKCISGRVEYRGENK